MLFDGTTDVFLLYQLFQRNLLSESHNFMIYFYPGLTLTLPCQDKYD